MNKKPTIFIAIVFALSTWALPAVADLSNYDDEKFVTSGPFNFYAQEGVGFYEHFDLVARLGLCLDDDLGTPPPAASCEPNPGTIQSTGAAFFDVPAGNGAGWEVEVAVQQVDGVRQGGFRIDGCSDVDDDGLQDWCTTSYAGNGEDCDSGQPNKDKKSCEDESNAGLVGCALRDDPLNYLGGVDNSFDEYIVYVLSWSDTTAINEDESITVGIPNPFAPGNIGDVTIYPHTDRDKSEKDHIAASTGTFRVRVDWQDELDRTDCFYELYGKGGGDYADRDQDESLMSRRQCSDGLDNDNDGLVDYPDDPGCDDFYDNDERN